MYFILSYTKFEGDTNIKYVIDKLSKNNNEKKN